MKVGVRKYVYWNSTYITAPQIDKGDADTELKNIFVQSKQCGMEIFVAKLLFANDPVIFSSQIFAIWKFCFR